MIRAYLYLYFTTLRNALAQRLKRLRQPKYLAGALAGAAYFYFFFFRHVIRGSQAMPAAFSAAGFVPLFIQLGALVILVIVALTWLVGSDRAALQFTEAEVAFLFPAPIPRRTLIHLKLLRSQLAIFVSAFFLTLVFGRGQALGGNAVTHAVGWWLILSTLSLHFVLASFARERLLHFGLKPARRRLLVGAMLLALATVLWVLLRHSIAAPTDRDLVSVTALGNYANHVLAQGPLTVLLAPFTLIVRPYFALDLPQFFYAIGPALLILILHYLLVVRSSVSFEEASIELAARQAQMVADLRAGTWRGRQGLKKPRPEPFPLAARGWIPVAFLWKNLIALGKFYRLRTWLVACAAVAGGLPWLASDPARLPLVKVAGGLAVTLSLMLTAFGPLFMLREIRQTLNQLDVTKAYPVAGWQLVMGQLLTPVLLITFVQWLFLLTASVSLAYTGGTSNLAWILGTGGAVGVALVIPPLCGLMLCIPYAGVLFFPAWTQTGPGNSGGVEMMGQRMIFMAGLLVILVVVLLPAGALGGLVFFISNVFLGRITALLLTALLAGAILAAEFAGAVWWLGGKLESFDLSTELPR